MRRNNQAAPVQDVPKVDNYLRCSHCKDAGKMYGTILSEVTVSVVFPGTEQPSEPLAKMWYCFNCGYALKRWLIPAFKNPKLHNDGFTTIPSTAEKYNITCHMVSRCLKKFPKCLNFTLQELRSATDTSRYNPDEYIEQKQDSFIEEVPF